jgi:RNA polymerase sigma-70 factor (ECF subfamily)
VTAATEAVESSDLDLIRLSQAGDADAFGELVERHRRAVFRAAVAAIGSAAEADDVAQETFVAAYRKLSSFRGDASFRTWLLAIAWRKAIDRRKSLTRWWKQTTVTGFTPNDEADPIEQLRDPGLPQDVMVASADRERRLRALIIALPRKLRDVLLLASSGDYTYQQISDMVGVPVGTVKWRVAEARRLLKRRF